MLCCGGIFVSIVVLDIIRTSSRMFQIDNMRSQKDTISLEVTCEQKR